MALDKIGSDGAEQINVNEVQDVQYWSREFGVSSAQLMYAVNEVGAKVKDVRRHLGALRYALYALVVQERGYVVPQ